MLRRMTLLVLCFFFLVGCRNSQPAQSEVSPQTTTVTETQPSTWEESEPDAEDTASMDFDPYSIINSMSVETLVGQLFLGSSPGKDSAADDIATCQPGGFVLFGNDVKNETPDSLKSTLASYQAASTIPMLFAVDEEGGMVTRLSRYDQYRSEPFSSPRELHAQGGVDAVLAAESEKCALLHSVGIHINLGPVCDITTDPQAFMYERSLGLTPHVTGIVVASTVHTMSSQGIGSVLKHFPGYGNNVDTHIGSAVDSRSVQELEENDLIPFAAGISAGCDAIMISHTVVSALDERYPASLSPAVHRYIREQMGFDGILMTDDLIMDAISDSYGNGEAAVLAVLAGNDMLCSGAFQEQYPAVLDAVQTGRIPLDSVKKSVARILTWKYKLGLII